MPALNQDQLDSFRANGYLIVRQLVDHETIVALRPAAVRLLKSDEAAASSRQWLDYPDGRRISLLEQPGRFSTVIAAYQKQPEIAEAAAALLDAKQVELVYDLLENIEPGTGAGLPFHQDAGRFGYQANARSLTAWTAFSNTVSRSGGLQIIPGSHQWGRIDCPGWSLDNPVPNFILDNCLDEARRSQAVPANADMESGDVLFIHSLALRGSRANSTSSDRIMLVQLWRA